MAPQKTVNRDWINSALLLLVLGLGSLIWLTESEQTDTAPTPLTQIEPDQINSIRLKNQSGPDIHLKREGDGWRMIKPYSTAANTVRIERLLQILVSPVYTHFEFKQNKLAQFGLAPPAAHLQLNQLEMCIGATDPINHYRYISIGKYLYLLKDQFPHLLLASAESYASPRILPAESDVVSVRTPKWKLTHQPNQAQVWQLEPAVEGISMDRLTEKVDEWKNAQALKVIKAPEDSFKTRLEIHLSGNPTPLTFGILRQQKRTLLVNQQSGLAYDLPRIEALLATPVNQTKVP